MKNSVIVGAVVVVVIAAVALFAAMNHSSGTNTSSSKSTAGYPSAATSQTSSKSASGGNVAITGGTNGPSCDSGGYFRPSSITITPGETVTFSVPSSDPYAGGLQINGLPGGNIVVPRGGSMTTSPISSTVSFYGTWPNATACKKGTGTITAQ